MTIRADVEAAFDSACQVDCGSIALGDRQPVRCLVPDGITRQRDDRRTVIAARVAVKKSDLGSVPRTNERASLTYAGETIAGAVASDEISEGGGALYSFQIEG